MKNTRFRIVLSLIFCLSLLWLVSSCASDPAPSHPRDPDPTHVDCARIDSFGDLNICLPAVPGWEECWRNPEIQEFLGYFQVSGGKVLGLYLDPKDAAHPSDTLGWQRKFLAEVVSIDLAKNIPINTDTLDQLVNQMAEISKDIAWDKATGEVITPSKMIPFSDWGLLEKYTQPNGIRTAALVQRKSSDHDAALALSSMNVMMIHGRFVGYFYVADYTGKGSILEFMRQSDKLGSYLAVGNR